MATETKRKQSANGASSSGNGHSGGNGSGSGEAPDRGATAALDALLTDVVMSPSQRWVPGVAGVKAAARLALRPQRVAKRGAGWAAELAKIAIGRSEVAPSKGDRRFADPTWQSNPGFRRLSQTYLVTASTIDEVVGDAELDWADERRVRFATENVVDLLAPSNFPLTNPTVVKATIDSRGRNFVKGARQLVADMSSKPRVPRMVDGSEFKVGENLAVTPGAVVHRTPVLELIQYEPQTTKVREKPLLFVPPMINKYYVTDLAPERSMIEYMVQGGQQVFTISWRNPDERHADWNLETYVQAVIEALDAVEAISGSEQSQAVGLCAGGITLATAAAYLSQKGEGDRLAGVSLAVCVIDNERAGDASAMLDRNLAQLAVAESARKGYLDGRALAGVFAWLRPNDLIWNYWINNYLLGKEPPAFDVLFWNADTTNMPAALHRDFIELSLENSLKEPGGMTILGTPIDLSKVTQDAYVVAGVADHIAPWRNCYRSAKLLGSEPRFVLSTSGHIAAMVNPPGNEKAKFEVGDELPRDPGDWRERASEQPGTWWEDWLEWISERSGEEKRARKKLGGPDYKPRESAPGTYVLEEVG